MALDLMPLIAAGFRLQTQNTVVKTINGVSPTMFSLVLIIWRESVCGVDVLKCLLSRWSHPLYAKPAVLSCSGSLAWEMAYICSLCVHV